MVQYWDEVESSEQVGARSPPTSSGVAMSSIVFMLPNVVE